MAGIGKLAKGLFDLLDIGKKSGEVVRYPDEWISQVPYELRKEVALHNEGILGSGYREGMEASPTYYRGGGTGRSELKPDTWMSSDPYQASTYAGKYGGGNVMPLKVSKDNIPEVYSNSSEWNRIGLYDSDIQIPNDKYTNELGTTMFGTPSDPYQVTDTNRIAGWAKGQGYGGVGIKGLKDVGPYQRGSNLDKVTRAESLVLSDPSKARSVNAVFDPAKASSSNLLASNPAATLGSAVLGDTMGKESQGLMNAIAGRDSILQPQETEYLRLQKQLQGVLGTKDLDNFNYSDLLPLKRSIESGDYSPAMTGILRDIIEGVHDVAQSSRTGVTNQQSLWDIIL